MLQTMLTLMLCINAAASADILNRIPSLPSKFCTHSDCSLAFSSFSPKNSHPRSSSCPNLGQCLLPQPPASFTGWSKTILTSLLVHTFICKSAKNSCKRVHARNNGQSGVPKPLVSAYCKLESKPGNSTAYTFSFVRVIFCLLIF